jgi:hypothetical protein
MDAKRISKDSDEYVRVYNLAKEWWGFWKFPVPPIEFLPFNMICAYDGERPVCIGFLYKSDSQMAWLEWIVADNKASKSDRALAIDLVLIGSKLVASTLGFGAVFTSSKNQSLNFKLEKKFKKTDENVTHFLGRI